MQQKPRGPPRRQLRAVDAGRRRTVDGVGEGGAPLSVRLRVLNRALAGVIALERGNVSSSWSIVRLESVAARS